jgi:hypothetical protein
LVRVQDHWWFPNALSWEKVLPQRHSRTAWSSMSETVACSCFQDMKISEQASA